MATTKHYYLMNGKNGIAHSIQLLVDDERVKEFNDISEIDYLTIDIPKSQAKNILGEIINLYRFVMEDNFM